MLNPSVGQAPADNSVRTNWLPNQQIALSRGVNDAGLFVLDFHDERYLPFEGTGAVSKWTLSLPPDTNRFDFGTISDIIVKIQYTAQDGGDAFRNKVKGLLYADNPPYPYTPAKIYDLKTAYAREWQSFISVPPKDGVQQIVFPLTDSTVLPYLKDVALQSAAVMFVTDGTVISDKNSDTSFVSLQLGTESEIKVPISGNKGTADLSGCSPSDAACRLAFHVDAAPGSILANGALDPARLLGAVVVITYQSNVFSKQ
jgi:hypothetical protein